MQITAQSLSSRGIYSRGGSTVRCGCAADSSADCHGGSSLPCPDHELLRVIFPGERGGPGQEKSIVRTHQSPVADPLCEN